MAAQNKRGGYVLIALLVVIAIGLMIYYADIGMLGGGGPRASKDREKPEDKPWAKEDRIKNSDQQPLASSTKESKPFIKKAAKAKELSKIKIQTAYTLSGPVLSDKQEKRGTIQISIDPNGNFTGTWNCAYSYTHASYKVKADFKGNSDPEQKSDENWSKLYIVSRGNYTQLSTNLDSGNQSQSKGIVYVNGWINEDKTASGKLSITNDKNWHVDYQWQAVPNVN